jgi:hypothetical protein
MANDSIPGVPYKFKSDDVVVRPEAFQFHLSQACFHDKTRNSASILSEKTLIHHNFAARAVYAFSGQDSHIAVWAEPYQWQLPPYQSPSATGFVLAW